MSALLKALMGQQSGEDKPNLATVTEFTTTIDSTSGRTKIPVGLQAKIERGKTYNVSFDVDVSIASVSNNSNFTQILSAWPNQFFDVVNWGHCTQSSKPGYKGTYHFDEITTAKSNDPEGTKNMLLQYDSSGVVGTYRAYNFSVTGV